MTQINERKKILNNLFHYILIFLTIFSFDILINLILYPESDKRRMLIGYILYFFIIAPLFMLLLWVINVVSQFSPSDDSSFFAFWSFLLVFAQLFPLMYKYLPNRFSGFAVLGALILSISYGIFWSYYAKKISESERKVLFLVNQILILSLIQFGTYYNVKYVRNLFTKNGLVLNLSLIVLFIISIILGRRIATFIIGKSSVKERLDTEEYSEIVEKIKKEVIHKEAPVKTRNEAKNKSSVRAHVFTFLLIVFNIICFLLVIIFPVKPVNIGIPPHNYNDLQEKLSKRNAPNIVLIVMDSVRAESMDLYGLEKPTMPFLKSWAKESTKYETAYSNSACSLATHASIFTGLYPQRHKAQYHYSKTFDQLDRPITFEDILQPLTDSNKTLAEFLLKNGYYTAAFNANNEALSPATGMDQGFIIYDSGEKISPPLFPYRLFEPADSFFSPLTKLYTGYKNARQITDEAVDFCEKNNKTEFFLFLNYMEGNLPLSPLPKYKKMFYDETKVRKARYPEQLKQILYYYAELRYLDDQLKRLLTTMKKFDWYDDSLIIITSAHGISLGEWGIWGDSVTLSERDIRIPLLVKYPLQKSRSAVEYPVQTADIFPTVLDVAGISYPKNIDGTDLRTGTGERFVAIIQKPSALVIDKYDNQYLRTLEAFIVGEEKIIISTNGPPQLYNLKNDPGERKNIAHERIDFVRKIQKEFSSLIAGKQGK